ncbi:MAG: S1 RNA-binding domain-containing protein [Bacteroidota bacterium]|jgi:small subunit ribosomal protein S1
MSEDVKLSQTSEENAEVSHSTTEQPEPEVIAEPTIPAEEKVLEPEITQSAKDKAVSEPEVVSEVVSPAIPEAVPEVITPVEPEIIPEVVTSVEPEAVAKVEEKTEEKPAESGEKQRAEAKEKADHARSKRQEQMDRVYTEIQKIKEEGKTIEVDVTSRIRGGLRVSYKDVPMFLPASHFLLKRTPTEQEMQEAVNKKYEVLIHEIQEYDEGKKAVIVSRKKMLLDDFWNKISIGDIVEGKVSSVASFGVFVDIGGVEGLIHISRLSKIHIDDPSRICKKGDVIQSVIIEIDKEKNRIALSRRELEESPWKEAEQLFPAGTRQKGIVRRITDFGAYIELKPGVDGLLRTSELSWTKRIKQPADLLTVGQEVEIEVVSISEEKQTVSLSYKKTLPNPWPSMVDKYPVGTEFKGTVVQVMPQGAIISISEEVDGFMPRSKMRDILHGKKIPFQSGDTMDVIIADLNVEEESLILSPKMTEEHKNAPEESRHERSNQGKRESEKPKSPASSAFSLGDLLSDNQKDQLNSMS